MWPEIPTPLSPLRPRSRLRRVLLSILGVVLVGCGSTSASPPGAAPAGWTGAELVTPLPKPSFVLTDQDGHPFDFRTRTQGKVTLLYFGYTHCPDICPLNMATAAGALRRLSPEVRSRIAVVFVTVDPARDTPPVLRDWLAHFDPSFIGLTGTLPQIELAELAARTAPSTLEPDGKGGYGVDHGGNVIAYTTDDLAHLEYPGGVSATGEAQDLARLVTRGWQAT
jgi:protein SCO1